MVLCRPFFRVARGGGVGKVVGVMEVLQFELPPIGTNSWLLVDKARREAALFDAPAEAWETVSEVLVKRGVRLTGLYLTHGHWDHILGAPRVAAAGVPVFAHRGDERLLADPGIQTRFMMMPSLNPGPIAVTHWVEGGQKLSILGREVEVRHVPGHAPGHVLFWFPSEGLAVSGDVILGNAIGRTDLPGGSFDELMRSILTQVLTLPDSARLLPGHGDASTVGEQKQSNSYVRQLLRVRG